MKATTFPNERLMTLPELTLMESIQAINNLPIASQFQKHKNEI